jgi:small subunit ribosomal protein S13
VARIAGIDIPRDKPVEISLTYIFGVGRTRASKAVEATGIKAGTRVRDLTEEEVIKLREFVEENYKIEGDLRREVSQNIKRLMEIGCYRGLRHRQGLPVRGQRTHTNARSRKGPRRQVGIKKKK